MKQGDEKGGGWGMKGGQRGSGLGNEFKYKSYNSASPLQGGVKGWGSIGDF
jgi:hypothetical protein